jgi:hypothetical protein
MADNIRIDLPGFPNSVPQWATEETLQEVAKQLGAKRSGVNSLDVSAKEAAKSTEELSKKQKAVKEGLTSLADTAGSVASTLFNTDGSLNSLLPVVESLTNLASKAAKGLFSLGSGIPLISGFASAASTATDVIAETTNLLFDVTTSIADSIADGFRGAASVGATLEGNFRELSNLSLGANISLEDLSDTLNQAGPALSAFTTSSEGARKVLGTLGRLQQDGTLEGFTRLGFTISELNEVGTDFLNILAQTGQTQMLNNMTEAELAKNAGAYATNLAVLSRLTGQNRKELQQQMREEQMRSNVQALLALKEQELTGDQLESFRNLQVGLRQFSPQLADAFASISTLGVASAEQEAILAQLGPTGDLIRQFATAFKDGTGDVNDADIQNILGSVAEGITNDQTLRTALLAPAGGFPAALADVVGEGLAFAQKFIAGDVDLAEIRAQVEKEREGRIEAAEQNRELVKSIIDAQTNVAQLSKNLQQAVLTSDAAAEIIMETANGITAVTDLLNRFLGFAETGEFKTSDLPFSNIEGDVTMNASGAVYINGGQVASGQGLRTSINAEPGTVTGFTNIGFEEAYQKAVDAQENKADRSGVISAKNIGKFTDIESMKAFLAEEGYVVPEFQRGTDGVMDFGAGSMAFLHGKEAVIPAPKGNIPVDLGNTLAPLEEMLTSLTNLRDNTNNMVAQEGVNSVQSNEVVSKLNEMIGVLKTIADGQYTGNSQFGKEIRRLGNSMSADLFR